MKHACEISYITAEPTPAVETGTAMESSQTPGATSAWRIGWQRVIDAILIEWGRNPSELQEHDLIPPTRPAINRAVEIARAWRDQHLPPPLRVVPDGDGGIVLERWMGSKTYALEIDQRGQVEFVETLDGKVVRRISF